MMKRTISIRELILLGVLVIAVVYYFALHKPLTAQMAEVQAQQTQVDTQLSAVMDKATEMKTMQKKLDDLRAASGGSLKGLPAYNNLNAVLLELNTILSAAGNYTIHFDDEVFLDDGYTVSRSFNLHFQAASYDAAKNVLDQIKNSSYCYLLQDMNVTNQSGTSGQGCSVNVELTCFEYRK